MKLSNFLYALLAGLVIYSLLIYTGGDTGLSAMAKAENYKEMLAGNLESIREINRELTVDFDALSSDNELIKLKARSLGYYEKDDHLVHIENWNPDYNEYKPGIVIKREYRTEVDEQPFRLTALAGTLFVLIITVLMNMAARQRYKS